MSLRHRETNYFCKKKKIVVVVVVVVVVIVVSKRKTSKMSIINSGEIKVYYLREIVLAVSSLAKEGSLLPGKPGCWLLF